MNGIFEVYTDGACANNQAQGGQPGGWGVVFLDGREFSGGSPSTTNNRMELIATIEALKNTPSDSQVHLFSDSAYIINAFNQHWIKNWLKNGWRTSQGKPVENQDLWLELIKLEQERVVKWVKVKGHSGNEWNEKADRLAVDAIPKKHQKDINKTSQKSIDISEEQVVISLSKQHYSLLLDTLEKLANENPIYRDLYKQLDKA